MENLIFEPGLPGYGTPQKTAYESHIISDSKLPFIFHLDTVKYSNCNVNWHENVEILMVTEGSGQVFCDLNKTDVEKGDIFVVNSNSVHYVYAESIIKYYCLIIDSEFCMANDIDTGQILFTNLVSNSNATDRYEKVVEEYTGEKDYKNAGIRSAVLDLLVYLCRNYAIKSEGKGTAYTSKTIENIKTSIGYIKANFYKNLTVDKLAFEVGLSKYYFTREFKKVTGQTVVTYINMIRCEHAKKLLSQKNYTVGEICKMVGFENFSYFSKTFRGMTGILPSEYRKQS